jgi:hypothetical protein
MSYKSQQTDARPTSSNNNNPYRMTVLGSRPSDRDPAQATVGGRESGSLGPPAPIDGHQQQGQPPVAYAGGAVEELSERAKVEDIEEYNLRDSTYLQLWCRALVTFFAEFGACFIYYLVVLTAKMTGASLSTHGWVECAAFVGVASFAVRENAGHLDPVITVLLLVCGRYGLPWYFCVAHFLGQAVAAITACLFVWAMTPGFDRTLGLGMEDLAPAYTPGQGLCAVLMGCFALYTVFLWIVNAADERNYYEQMGANFKHNTVFSLACGLTHLAVALCFGPIAGSYFNWYLYFFPAIMSGANMANWWIWFVGPMAAGIFTLAFYYLYHWVSNMAFKSARSVHLRND